MSQSVIIIHTEGQDHIVVGFKSFQIDLEFFRGRLGAEFPCYRETETPSVVDSVDREFRQGTPQCNTDG